MSKLGIKPIDAVKPIHMACGAVAAGIFVTAGALGIIPAYKARTQHQEQRATLTAVKAELDSVGTTHTALINRVTELEDQVGGYGYILTPASDLNRRLSELTTMLESHAFEATELHPQTIVESGRVDYLPMRLAATGSLESILQLLDTLETQHPDLHVHNIAIEAAGPETLRLRATLRWFVAPN